MKSKVLSLLVAIFFTAGAFAVPVTVSAQGSSGQTLTQGETGQKATTKKSNKNKKKSKKKSKSTKPSSTKKSKSKKTQGQQA